MKQISSTVSKKKKIIVYRFLLKKYLGNLRLGKISQFRRKILTLLAMKIKYQFFPPKVQ